MRYFIGYLLGFGLFYIATPWALIGLHVLTMPLLPYPLLPFEWLRWSLVAFFLTVGLGFSFWSTIALFVIGKGGPTDGFGKAITPRTKKLVTSGPYRYARNPMAFGTFLCYFALGSSLDSIVIIVFLLIMLPVALAYIRRYEEQRLTKDFGNEFTEYKQRVAMFFPWPRKK
jgi:protein-S-isoprenylcysteine O-methyltransferase Ste14